MAVRNIVVPPDDDREPLPIPTAPAIQQAAPSLPITNLPDPSIGDSPYIENPSIIPGQGDVVPLPPAEPGEFSIDERIQQEAAASIRPFVGRPVNYMEPQVPNFLLNPGEGADPLPIQQYVENLPEESVTTTQDILRDLQSYRGSRPLPAPVQQFGDLDTSIVEQAWADRAAAEAQQTVAPGNGIPLTGVVRSMFSRQPFNRAAEEGTNDFLARTLGVDFSAAEGRESEPTRPLNPFERAIRAVGDAGSALALGPLGALIPDSIQGELFPDGRTTVSANRILGDALRVAQQRASGRIADVGLGQFIGENTLGRLPSVQNYSSSLARSIRQGNNPVQPWAPEPQEFLGVSGQPSRINDSFIGDLAERSPEFRNLLLQLQPAINASGEQNFNPLSGDFGDFGSAGALSAILWAANIPEGVLQGALYDAADLHRYLDTDGHVERLLGRHPWLQAIPGVTAGVALLDFVTPGEGAPPQANLNRLDTVGALFGRDYGFTQENTEDRYLGMIGHPSLRWIPQGYGIQTGLGFLADAVTGGFSDAAIVDPIWRRVQRGTRRAASEVLEQGAQTVTQSVPETAYRNLDSLSVRVNRTITSTDESLLTRSTDVSSTLSRYGLDSTDTPALRVGQRTIPVEPIPRLVREAPSVETVVRRIEDSIEVPTVALTRRVDEISDSIRQMTTTLAEQEQLLAKAREAFDAAPKPASVVEFPPETRLASENLRTAQLDYERYTRIKDNFIQERDTLLTAIKSADDVQLVVTDAIRRANLYGEVELTEAGDYLLQYVDEIDLDSLLPKVNLSNILPNYTKTVPEGIALSRIAPQAVEPSYFRRQLESIGSLAHLTGEPKYRMNVPDSPLASISNSFRADALEYRHPELFARYGKPLESNINSPLKRIQVGDTNFAVANPQFVPRQTVNDSLQRYTQTPVPRSARRQYEKLTKKQAKLTDQLTAARATRNNERMLQLEESYNRNLAEINDLFADHPELYVEEFTRQLPDSLRPVGAASEAIAPEYVEVVRTFQYETRQLRRLRNELAETDQLIRQQRAVVEQTAPIGRINPANEFATNREYGGPQVFATSEKLQPSAEVKLDKLPDNIQVIDTLPLTPEQTEYVLRKYFNEDGTPTGTRTTQEPPPTTITEPIKLDSGPTEEVIEGGVRVERQVSQLTEPESSRVFTDPLEELPPPDRKPPDIALPRTQVVDSTVDAVNRGARLADQNITYSELQQVAKKLELKANGSRDELFARVNAFADSKLEVDGSTYRSVSGTRASSPVLDPESPGSVILYHGTKSTGVKAKTFALSNEYGVGLYTTPDPSVAEAYAKAKVGNDLVSEVVRPRFENQGRVFGITLYDDARILDLTNQESVELVRQEFITSLREMGRSDLVSKFTSWSKNHEPREYWHYVRSQILRDSGVQKPYLDFAYALEYRLSRKFDALDDGETVVILASSPYFSSVKMADNVGDGTLLEGFKYRLAIDQDLMRRVNTPTTRSMVEQARLDLDTYQRNQLHKAVKKQERIATDQAKKMGQVEQQVDDAVAIDTKQSIQRQLTENEKDAVRRGNASLKNNDICL